MPERQSEEEQQRLYSILDFWHTLEFFIPFDLDLRLDDAEEGRVRWLYAPGSAEPEEDLWQASLPDGFELRGFYLYLGVFDKREIAALCHAVAGIEDRATAIEDAERAELEGNTCFARLTVSADGQLVFDPTLDAVSISTVPWAMGQLRNEGFAALTSRSFEQAKQQLAQLLQSFQSYRKPAGQPLTRTDVLALHQLFCKWASYSPFGHGPVAAIEIRTARKRKPKPVDELNRDSRQSTGSTARQTMEDDDPAESDEPEPLIGILNSFFLEDIERAMAMVQTGECPSPLHTYLLPHSTSERLDLDSEAGREEILQVLHPARWNQGHWFEKPERPMSLMQQFAINSIVALSEPRPLFAVNGPPGTGKTTLLRDAFAEIVVRRARALSQLQQPKDAFECESVPVRFSGDSKPTWIKPLKPELTGFEMVVASSNNTAVENISRELPKREGVDDTWSAISYLQPVAHKIAAQQDDGSVHALPAEQIPWGLISCVLGKSANRSAFKERFAFMRLFEDEPETSRWQTIYEWIDAYRGPSFRDAVIRFRNIEEELEARATTLQQYADLLHDRMHGLTNAETEAAGEQFRGAEAAQQSLIVTEQRRQTAAQELRGIESRLEHEARLIERTRPGVWPRLRRTHEAQTYRQRCKQNAEAQLRCSQKTASLEREQVRLQEELALASIAVHEAETHFEQACKKRSLREAEWLRMQQKFPELTVPASREELSSEHFQITGLWHDAELARLRSALFGAALQLHEAWLAGVARKKEHGGAGFRGNLVAVTKLLSNKRPDDRSQVTAIWQSLFLVVPIVSTTFAALANQLRDVRSQSLGWLFIDEAGQAVPQAAVGGLWRFRRGVVVGDPRQIEPIFTLPSRFISAIAARSPYTSDGSYAPHRASVQTLADAANSCGVYLSEEDDDASTWVGSPLRVHRRCEEPMFSWSNFIAYNQRMILKLPEARSDAHLISCDTAWIDLRGETRRRQEVPGQTRFVTEVMSALYRRDQRLPDIYLITPFRAIKNELIKALTGLDWRQLSSDGRGPGTRALRKWCRARVGTIHTFQGKEEDVVFLVLGADPFHLGAVEWASSKPNILNVALTRAKRRVYLIGDRQLWGSKGPFRWSVEKIPTISPETFLAGCGAGTQARSVAR